MHVVDLRCSGTTSMSPIRHISTIEAKKARSKIMGKNKLIDFSGPSKDPKVNYEINSIKSEQCFMCKNIQDQLGKDYWSFDGYLE